MFACQHEDVTPTFCAWARGDRGYLPLAATVATEQIYEGFLGEGRTFFHGHTFTGNPLACAAGLATLEVFEQERTLELLGAKIELLARNLDRRVAVLPLVSDVRQRGFMVGIELGGGTRASGWATRWRSPRAPAVRSSVLWTMWSCSCLRWPFPSLTCVAWWRSPPPRSPM